MTPVPVDRQQPDTSAAREAEIREWASGTFSDGKPHIPANVPSYTRDLLAMLEERDRTAGRLQREIDDNRLGRLTLAKDLVSLQRGEPVETALAAGVESRLRESTSDLTAARAESAELRRKLDAVGRLATTAREWRDAKTELPDTDRDVLLSGPGQRVIFGWYDWLAGFFRADDNSRVSFTHWMPVPSPPGPSAERMPPELRGEPAEAKVTPERGEKEET